ncbi:MAG: transcriptional regulator, AraC family [Thermoleophilia bacterium]|nr:transcriptional regulator, AraC family [Thermoleophilia bacterium]
MTARHLQRARDLVDAHFAEPLDVDEMARAAGFSKAHFSRAFKAAFGETPRAYLLTRRLERAATLLRSTDWPVAEVCWAVGLTSVGSFTTTFTRTYGMSPTAWRAAGPPAAAFAMIPSCVRKIYGRKPRRTFREAPGGVD